MNFVHESPCTKYMCMQTKILYALTCNSCGLFSKLHKVRCRIIPQMQLTKNFMVTKENKIWLK